MEIKNAQKIVDKWINEHGVRYFNELTNMAILSEEVGEVARIIARKYGEQSSKENDNIENLADELSDVLFVLISGVFTLANQQWPPIGFSLLWLCHCKSLTMFATDNFRSLPTMFCASGLICNLKKDFFTNSTTTTSLDVSHVAS